MKIKILHLYYDFMNLYGEYANTLALRDKLISMGEDCEIEKKTFGDDIILSDYDFIYIGSGTERNQKIVLEDMRPRAEELKKYVEAGKPVLMTGNSFEILGKSIIDAAGKKYEGLNLFDFEVTEQNKRRDTADCVFTADFIEGDLVGFVNKCSEIRGVGESLFTVKEGLANAEGEKGEGVRLNNLFGTHLIGPALMRNPKLCEYMADITLNKDQT